MRLIYHPDAESELIEAARYYEIRVATLGIQFLNEADRAVTIMLEAPQRWRIIEQGVRIYSMPRFPYAVYYRDFPDRLHILAFKHHRRHPHYWRYRISQ
jgi:plasmid stabilization system protein ParE